LGHDAELIRRMGGPTMFARIGFMRALNKGMPNHDATPRRKRAKAYKIVK